MSEKKKKNGELADLSIYQLARHYAAAVGAQEAAMELDDEDEYLFIAACEVSRLYRKEIERRTLAVVDAQDQKALDELNGALREASTRLRSEQAVTVILHDHTLSYLRALAHSSAVRSGNVVDVLEYLAASAADGVRRPGSWERGWCTQAFGDFPEGEPEPGSPWSLEPPELG